MKTIRICAVLFLFPFIAFSAEKRAVNDTVIPNSQVDSLNNLINHYLGKENFQKVLEYNFMITEIYGNLGDIENMARSYNRIVNVFIRIKAFDLAEKYQRILAQIIGRRPNDAFQGWLFSNQSQLNSGKGELDEAIRNLYISIYYFHKGKETRLEARGYRLLGDVFVLQKLYNKALYAYKSSTILLLQSADELEIAVNYTRMAHIYQVRDDNQYNLLYNLKALHIREKLGASKMINNSYLNVGEAYWLIGKKDSARFFLEKALKLAEQNNNIYLLEIIYRELSGFANQDGRFKDAFTYYTKSVDYRKKYRDEQNEAEIGLIAANHSIRDAAAKNDLLKQENQIQELKFNHGQIKTILYEVVFLFMMALIVFINTMARTNMKRKKKLLALNDQLKAEIQERIEAEGRLLRNEALYRFLAEHSIDVTSLLDANMHRLYISPSCEKFYGYTPAEILQMSSPLELVEPSHRVTVNYHLLELFHTKKMSQYRYRALRKDGSSFWAESVISPIIDPVSDEITEMITNVRDISQQITYEEELAENERQKDYLLKEIHNRVKNNFAILISLMEMQRDQAKNSELNSSISDLQLRVRTMSLVHEQLYHTQNISAIPFDDYLRNLTLIIASSFKNDRIKLMTDIRACTLPIELALPMGLIVNELITNVYKYAFPGTRTGTVWVKLLPEGDEKHSIIISDNGIGLPENFDIKKPQSMGTQIVQILVEQVDAQLDFTVDDGTCFRILFSTKQEK